MKARRWHSCNILDAASDPARLWQFESGNGEVTLSTELRRASGELFPARTVGRGWQALWRSRLNVAWLPLDQVFVCALQLPHGDPSEIVPMVELQLEKISPLPTNQILWSVEPLPNAQADSELQTVLVTIVPRDPVEELLGRLEKSGYLADRLELPMLHELQTRRPSGAEAWVYLAPAGLRTMGLVAWWHGGSLRRVDILNLSPEGDRALALAAQLNQLCWAGELEGWYSPGIQWRLVADDESAAAWEPALRAWAPAGVVRESALLPADLAALSARRATRNESQVNLLPGEYSRRYRQQLIDRLWMRALGALIALYLVGVGVYFGALQTVRFQLRGVQDEIAQVSGSYTNTLELKARAEILQEQSNLKYAVLDCWKAVSENMKPELTLLTFNFQGGRQLTLQGTVSADEQIKVTEFNDALKKVLLGGVPLFKNVQAPSLTLSPNAAAAASPGARWGFICEINRSDVP